RVSNFAHWQLSTPSILYSGHAATSFAHTDSQTTGGASSIDLPPQAEKATAARRKTKVLIRIASSPLGLLLLPALLLRLISLIPLLILWRIPRPLHRVRALRLRLVALRVVLAVEPGQPRLLRPPMLTGLPWLPALHRAATGLGPRGAGRVDLRTLSHDEILVN